MISVTYPGGDPVGSGFHFLVGKSWYKIYVGQDPDPDLHTQQWLKE
jgi:hypothetical protein